MRPREIGRFRTFQVMVEVLKETPGLRVYKPKGQ